MPNPKEIGNIGIQDALETTSRSGNLGDMRDPKSADSFGISHASTPDGKPIAALGIMLFRGTVQLGHLALEVECMERLAMDLLDHCEQVKEATGKAVKMQ